ncbi:MCE family protein [Nocardia huaxiensis]|uniref:MCE family protein n=1 Tax=Nocardia huaxiensis TaxID=2755382 RepID=A0A7D6VC98_9NOCA|nr:MlaD family protein [Nocardia huaxiensis]QLY28855.1 MCE family protein [Nocardia huaxiensis]
MRIRKTAIAVLAGVLTTAACGFDPAQVDVPGTRVGGPTYMLRIEFPNALNLPPGAKVIANGVLAGNLDGLEVVEPGSDSAGKGFVVATVDITESVRLPANVTAELRQATPLGDVHIALTSPPDATGPALGDGATIPLRQTVTPLQVEDTLAGLATAMGSGAILDLQKIVRQLNTALPDHPEQTARMFAVLGADFTDVAAHLDDVDSFLEGLEANARQILDDEPMLSKLLADYGVEHVSAVVNSVLGVLLIMSALAPVATNAAWLAPAVAGLDDTAKALVPLLFTNRPLDLNAPSNLNAMVALLRDKIIPFAERGPKVNVVGATIGDTDAPAVAEDDQVQRILETLRMIGAVR